MFISGILVEPKVFPTEILSHLGVHSQLVVTVCSPSECVAIVWTCRDPAKCECGEVRCESGHRAQSGGGGGRDFILTSPAVTGTLSLVVNL